MSEQLRNQLKELRKYLHAVLDKHDGRYEYPTYICLDLMNLPDSEAVYDDLVVTEKLCHRKIVQYVADAMAFELDTLDGTTDLQPEMPPTRDLVQKRLAVGLRAITPNLRRLGMAEPNTNADPFEEARVVVDDVRVNATEEELCDLELTLMPVYRVHDEIMFIRTLQSYEVTFTLMAIYLFSALKAIEDCDAATAARHIAEATRVLRDARLLFSFVATMQPEAFRNFRDFTDGASAIQSRSYKTVESLCSRPNDKRLNCPAYESVPEVHDAVLADRPTIHDLYRCAKARKAFTAEQCAAIEGAMSGFDNAWQSWRSTHLKVATRILGNEVDGTGGTNGLPYLQSVLGIPVFPPTRPPEGKE